MLNEQLRVKVCIHHDEDLNVPLFHNLLQIIEFQNDDMLISKSFYPDTLSPSSGQQALRVISHGENLTCTDFIKHYEL